MPLDTVLKKLPKVINDTIKSGLTNHPEIDLYRQPQVTGTVLYPLSAGDVVGPLSVFPNADRYVFIDRDSFTDPNPQSMDDIFNVSYLNRLISYFRSIPANIGMFGPGVGAYDVTGVYGNLEYYFNITPHISSELFGLSHLMLSRLRACCAVTIVDITSVPGTDDAVFSIKFKNSADQIKELILVKSHLGKREAGYRWLYAQNFVYSSLLMKGFPYGMKDIQSVEKDLDARLMSAEILTLLAREQSMTKDFMIITDQPLNSRENNLLIKQKESLVKEIELKKGSFGYGNFVRVYNKDQLAFDMYSVQKLMSNEVPDVAQYPITSEVLDIREKYQMKVRAAIEAEEKFKKACQDFLNSSPENKFEILQKLGLIKVNGKVLTIIAKNDNQVKMPYRNENVFIDLLKHSKEIGIDQIQIILNEPGNTFAHQEVPFLFIKRLKEYGSHIVSVIIEPELSEKTSYKNSHSIPVAQALKENGKNLRHFSVKSNTTAALIFVDAFRFLAENHCLESVALSPLKSWRESNDIQVKMNEVEEIIKSRRGLSKNPSSVETVIRYSKEVTDPVQQIETDTVRCPPDIESYKVTI